MPISKRLIYALLLLIATTMIVMLVLSIGEGIGLVRDLDVQALMVHPLYLLVVYAVGFALAPKLHQSTPISGDSQPAKFGYAARVTVLAAIGLVLALLANLVVYVLGRFS